MLPSWIQNLWIHLHGNGIPIVAKGVKISTDQFFPQKISTKKAPVFRLFSRVFACFSRVFPKN